MREWLKNMVTEAAHQMGSELKQMGAHGSHELAAALFNGSAFVMYPRGTREDVHQPEQAQIEHEREM
jgi:hypothetical protein